MYSELIDKYSEEELVSYTFGILNDDKALELAEDMKRCELLTDVVEGIKLIKGEKNFLSKEEFLSDQKIIQQESWKEIQQESKKLRIENFIDQALAEKQVKPRKIFSQRSYAIAASIALFFIISGALYSYVLFPSDIGKPYYSDIQNSTVRSANFDNLEHKMMIDEREYFAHLGDSLFREKQYHLSIKYYKQSQNAYLAKFDAIDWNSKWNLSMSYLYNGDINQALVELDSISKSDIKASAQKAQQALKKIKSKRFIFYTTFFFRKEESKMQDKE